MSSLSRHTVCISYGAELRNCRRQNYSVNQRESQGQQETSGNAVTELNGNAAKFKLLSRLLDGIGGEAVPLDLLLSDTARMFGLPAVGLRLPIRGPARINLFAGLSEQIGPVTSDEDAISQIQNARSSADIVFDARQGERLLIPLLPEGAAVGVMWADRNPSSSWVEADVYGLVVAARLLTKSSEFISHLGPVVDQGRLNERLADAARISGKIAHDFDNIFTGVVGFADMVLGMLQPGTQAHKYLAEVSAAGNRGIQFTQQLHHLSRSGGAKPMPAAPLAIIAREEARLKISHEKVKLQINLPADLPAVAMESGALQMILGHLLDNAVEATPPGGSVRVTATRTEISAGEMREWLGCPGPGAYLLIRIRDEGTGIKDDYRRKMFVEPFFTSKPRHRGLGLAIVYRTLHAHRGGVRVDAGPDRGTTIEVVVPLAAVRPKETPFSGTESARTPGGNAP